MSSSLGLSVIIITLNEERDLGDCLESVKSIADEIVLSDSGSTDKTLDIAKKFGARIFHKEWTGYGPLKQSVLDEAKGPWVLNIDADERLTPPLQKEIADTLHSESARPVNGYEIPYRHFFLGKRLRFGGCGGEKHVRLFRKDKGRYGDARIHEGIHVEPPIGRLQWYIDHESYKSIEEYLFKCNHYTTLIAEAKFKKGERFHWWHHGRLPFEFFSRYILKLGFLDGRPGFTYALLSSFYAWLKFLKLKDREAGRC
ncbi:MAG: glycosyltransferase family 2 protein [Elusimicrobia bacterium]|nr:glycosyltransferase family 2 protein [Candidatus Obscuribacterium magneticum]